MIRTLCLALLGSAVMSPVWAEVTLTAEQRENLGIATEPFRPTQIEPQVPAAGQVLDASTLIGTLGDLRTAEISAIASREESNRTEQLYRDDKNVARKAFDAARIQANTDETRVTTLKGQLIATWGNGVANMPAAARAALLKDLLSGRASLIRADRLYASATQASFKGASVATLDDREQWTAQYMGPLPQTAGGTVGGAALLRVRVSLQLGQPLTVNLISEGAGVSVMSAPASAVIRWRGAEWVYAETSANRFERLAVQAGPRAAGRAVLTGKESPKGQVVTVGARSLLGAELGASDAGAEAGGE